VLVASPFPFPFPFADRRVVSPRPVARRHYHARSAPTQATVRHTQHACPVTGQTIPATSLPPCPAEGAVPARLRPRLPAGASRDCDSDIDRNLPPTLPRRTRR
jgi:hypothetical protein